MIYSERNAAAMAASYEQLRKALAEATITLMAIGEPKPNTPPDAHLCGVMARSALARIDAAIVVDRRTDDD